MQQLLGAGPDLAPGQAEVAAVDHQVVEHGELGVEVVVLRDDAQASPDGGAVVARVHPEDAQLAVGLTGETVAIMRIVVVLPAPFGPEEAEDLAAAHLEVDAVDRHVVAEALRQRLGLDEGSVVARVVGVASGLGLGGAGFAGVGVGGHRIGTVSADCDIRPVDIAGRSGPRRPTWAAAPLRATLAAKRSGMRPIGRACGVIGNGAVQIESVDRPEIDQSQVWRLPPWPIDVHVNRCQRPRGRVPPVAGRRAHTVLPQPPFVCTLPRIVAEWPGSAAVRRAERSPTGRSRGRTTTDALNSVVLNLRSLLGSGRADVTDVVRTGRTRGPCPGRVRVPAPSCGARA